jgi:hypothetical protein
MAPLSESSSNLRIHRDDGKPRLHNRKRSRSLVAGTRNYRANNGVGSFENSPKFRFGF